VCEYGEICRKGECRCPEGAVCGTPPVLGNGALEEGDPVASGECYGVPRRYDAITFDHPGGAASLVVWGAPSGRGTLPDPALFLFSGSTVPADLCGYLAFNDDFCTLEPYLEFTDLAAGTYTAVIVDFGNSTGTYTFERDTFTPPLCV
jgi:hypothetical protein